MATQKYTIAQGQRASQIVQAAGSAIAGGNALEVNIDTTNITRNEAAIMLQTVLDRVATGPWPPA